MSKFHSKKETKRVGDHIKDLRDKNGWSIEDISAMTGFARSTITRIEEGLDTTTSHLIEIAKAIGVQPNELLNIHFDLKPRYKLTGKRKDQLKLTQKLRLLIDQDFFSKPQTVAQVIKELNEHFDIKAESISVSSILIRFKNEGLLKSTKAGRKNLYSIKSRKI